MFRQDPNCRGCPMAGAEGGPDPDQAWLSHLLRLSNMVSAGCSFRLDDLSVAEWDGLVTLRHENNRLARERMNES